MNQPFGRRPPARFTASRSIRVVGGGWVWLAGLAVAAKGLLIWPMLVLAIAVGVLAMPAAAALWHQDAVARTLSLHPYRQGAWLHRWTAKRVIPMVLRAMLALMLAGAALVQTPFMHWGDWALLAAAAPLFALVDAIAYRLGSAQFSDQRYAQRGLQRTVRGIVLMLLAAGWIALRLADHGSTVVPLGERVAQWQAMWAQAPSHALRWSLDALAWGHAGTETALSALPADQRYQAFASVVLAPLTLFGYSALAIAGSSLSMSDLRRAAAVPLTAAEIPARLTPAHTGIWAAVGILAVWMWLDIAGRTEYLARSVPSAFAVQLVPECERIGGQVYRVGTEALLAQLQLQSGEQLAAIEAQACSRLSQVRALTESGVDAYLDWYFSLGAEWARLAAMLAGDADLLMRVKFEQLALQSPLIIRTMDAILRDHEALWTAAQRAGADALVFMESQRLVLTEGQCKAVTTTTSNPVLLQMQGSGTRWAASSGAGLAVGSFAGAVAAKAMSKVSMKAASKLLAKAAIKKGIGKAGSAAAGAAIGSAMAPGVGTVIGAGVGVVVGLALGAGVDMAMLAAEEKLTRDDMRRDLLAAVDQSLKPYRTGFSCP